MKEPIFCSSKLLAKLLDLSQRRVRQLNEMGVMHRTQFGEYDLFQSIQGYIHYLRRKKRIHRNTEHHYHYDKILSHIKNIEHVLVQLKESANT